MIPSANRAQRRDKTLLPSRNGKRFQVSESAGQKVTRVNPGDRVLVCGAGPAGLTAAYLLSEHDVRVAVVEAGGGSAVERAIYTRAIARFI